MGIEIAPAVAGALVALLDRIELEPQNLTAVEGVEAGVDRHLADSLSALVLPELRAASSIVDIGSGGGFPGLPLAMALPGARVTLVESETRKAEWLRRASADLRNVAVVAERSEDLARRERERADVVTARAVGGLPTVLELAAPLLAEGGTVVLWRGARDPDEERRGDRAAAELGLGPAAIVSARPFPGAHRHLHVRRRQAPTPARYPRRSGRAAKRPIA